MEFIMLGVGLLLTIGTGLFVASEFALVNLDRADLEARQAAGETRLSLTISALKITSPMELARFQVMGFQPPF